VSELHGLVKLGQHGGSANRTEPLPREWCADEKRHVASGRRRRLVATDEEGGGSGAKAATGTAANMKKIEFL
jgi:hypothetical protein